MAEDSSKTPRTPPLEPPSPITIREHSGETQVVGHVAGTNIVFVNFEPTIPSTFINILRKRVATKSISVWSNVTRKEHGDANGVAKDTTGAFTCEAVDNETERRNRLPDCANTFTEYSKPKCGVEVENDSQKTEDFCILDGNHAKFGGSHMRSAGNHSEWRSNGSYVQYSQEILIPQLNINTLPPEVATVALPGKKNSTIPPANETDDEIQIIFQSDCYKTPCSIASSEVEVIKDEAFPLGSVDVPVYETDYHLYGAPENIEEVIAEEDKILVEESPRIPSHVLDHSYSFPPDQCLEIIPIPEEEAVDSKACAIEYTESGDAAERLCSDTGELPQGASSEENCEDHYTGENSCDEVNSQSSISANDHLDKSSVSVVLNVQNPLETPHCHRHEHSSLLTSNNASTSHSEFGHPNTIAGQDLLSATSEQEETHQGRAINRDKNGGSAHDTCEGVSAVDSKIRTLKSSSENTNVKSNKSCLCHIKNSTHATTGEVSSDQDSACLPEKRNCISPKPGTQEKVLIRSSIQLRKRKIYKMIQIPPRESINYEIVSDINTDGDGNVNSTKDLAVGGCDKDDDEQPPQLFPDGEAERKAVKKVWTALTSQAQGSAVSPPSDVNLRSKKRKRRWSSGKKFTPKMDKEVVIPLCPVKISDFNISSKSIPCGSISTAKLGTVHRIPRAGQSAERNDRLHQVAGASGIPKVPGRKKRYMCFCRYNTILPRASRNTCCGKRKTKPASQVSSKDINYPTDQGLLFHNLGLMDKSLYNKDLQNKLTLPHRTRQLRASQVKEKGHYRMILNSFRRDFDQSSEKVKQPLPLSMISERKLTKIPPKDESQAKLPHRRWLINQRISHHSFEGFEGGPSNVVHHKNDHQLKRSGVEAHTDRGNDSTSVGTSNTLPSVPFCCTDTNDNVTDNCSLAESNDTRWRLSSDCTDLEKCLVCERCILEKNNLELQTDAGALNDKVSVSPTCSVSSKKGYNDLPPDVEVSMSQIDMDDGEESQSRIEGEMVDEGYRSNIASEGSASPCGSFAPYMKADLLNEVDSFASLAPFTAEECHGRTWELGAPERMTEVAEQCAESPLYPTSHDDYDTSLLLNESAYEGCDFLGFDGKVDFFNCGEEQSQDTVENTERNTAQIFEPEGSKFNSESEYTNSPREFAALMTEDCRRGKERENVEDSNPTSTTSKTPIKKDSVALSLASFDIRKSCRVSLTKIQLPDNAIEGLKINGENVFANTICKSQISPKRVIRPVTKTPIETCITLPRLTERTNIKKEYSGSIKEDRRRYLTDASGKRDTFPGDSVGSSGSSSIDSFQCFACLIPFKSKDALMNHLENHKPKKSLTCVVCKLSFTQKIHLKAHMRIHNSEKPFACQGCGKGFIRLKRLKNHIRTHCTRTLTPFKCSICSVAFKSQTSLKKHFHVHLRDSKNPVVRRGRPYIVASSLRRHTKAHSREKTVLCPV